MGYLEDFQTQIGHRDFSKFMQLWEEYCASDSVEATEFISLLQTVKLSDFAKSLGRFIEMALPLWKTFENANESYEILKHLIDIQTTNSPLLAELSLSAIKARYGTDPHFNERARLIGLRTKDNFQGAISNYDLLQHMKMGHFVFHTGGWGTGEIVEVSPLREQLIVEFENVAGKKHVTFSNAFKMLTPLATTHFLARRFADPDKLEQEAKEDPVAIIKDLLRDLGPKTAAELKDELCELVIPEKEWTKWWQGARAKLKKDDMVESPEGVKGAFYLRNNARSHDEYLEKSFGSKSHPTEVIQACYLLLKDLPKGEKREEILKTAKEKLFQLTKERLSKSDELQLLILLEEYFSHALEGQSPAAVVAQTPQIEEVVNKIEIIALRKKALILIREHRPDWIQLFCNLLHTTEHSTLRDYLVKELNEGEAHHSLLQFLDSLLNTPINNPELFFWYFQKVSSKDKSEFPFSDKKGLCQLLESFLILLSQIESKPEYKDLTKKMYTALLAKRYAIIRHILEHGSLTFTKEFLLLASKCQTFTDHDQKILRSLAEVVHPSLSKNKGEREVDLNTIWTTEAGYLKTQERIKQVGTVEIVENAREIEAARALGDLRENSEYKFALERRSRLQGELKTLSEQLRRTRLITPHDISPSEVGIGNVVKVKDEAGKQVTYTILGPWEADPNAHILSFQSKLAQAMCGLKVGDTFTFKNENFTITAIKSYLS